MADHPDTLRKAEEALAKCERYEARTAAYEVPFVVDEMVVALRSLLAAAREAEEKIATATRERDEARRSLRKAVVLLGVGDPPSLEEAELAAIKERDDAFAMLDSILRIDHIETPDGDESVADAVYNAIEMMEARAEKAEAALAEEREKSAKAERRAERAAVALTRAHEVIAQQRSLIDPEEYPEIDAAAGEVIDPWPPPGPAQELLR